jgi:DNA polymerase-3 subunit delta
MPHLHVISGPGAAIRRLLADVTDKLASRGYTETRREEACEWGSLLSENRGRGLWDDRSVVIVEDAEKLGPMPKQLASMLEGPDADTHILLVCKSEGPSLISKEHAGLCTFAKASTPPPWSRERDGIILSEAKKQGARVAPDALSLLKELFEDTGELAAETSKVAGVCLLRKRSEISAADVEELCLSDGNRNLLKLLDGLCAKSETESLAILDDMGGRSELLPLLSALHNRFRLAMYFALFPRERAGITRAFGTKDYASRQADSAVRKYGAEKLKNFVAGIIRITSNERIGQGASWRDLSLLVIDLLN